VERATEVYGVGILVTSAVLGLCTPEMAAKCRIIDRVLAPGYLEPLELFAIDLNYFFLETEEPVHFKWNSRQRFRSRQYLEGEKKKKLLPDCIVVEQFDTDLDINTMRAPYTLEFMQIFNMGFQNYNQGEWEVAGRILWNTRTMLGFEDGPSSALLRYMRETSDFKCPEGWHGIHHLEEFGRMGPPVNLSGGRRYSNASDTNREQLQKLVEVAYMKEATNTSQALSREESAVSSMFGGSRRASKASKQGGDIMKENPLPPEPLQQKLDPALYEVPADVPVEEPALKNRRNLKSK